MLRWERHRQAAVPLTADVLMRGWYLESVGERSMVTGISQRLAELAAEAGNRTETGRVLAERPGGGWVAEAGPREMA